MKHAGLPEVRGVTGKKAPPANVAFGGTLTATRSRVPAGTLGASQPGSPARTRPRQVSTAVASCHRLDSCRFTVLIMVHVVSSDA